MASWSRRPAPGRLARLLGWGCWAYLGLAVGAWALLAAAADWWWPATLFMYGPRWVLLLPAVVLVPAAALARRRLLGPLAAALAVVLGPVMGFSLPLEPRPGPDFSAPRLRLLTCNVHYKDLDAAALRALIADVSPDVVALQGCSASHPAALFGEEGWYVRSEGELCLASRHPIRGVEVFSDPAFADRGGAALRGDLDTPAGRVHLINLHLATPRFGLESVLRQRWREFPGLVEENSDLRRRQSELIRARAGEVDGPLLLAGDFNTPPDSATYRRCWSSLSNAYSSAGVGWGYTYFTQHAAVRIDHILAGDGWRCRACWVGPDVGSPHRPVVADLEWVGPAAPGVSSPRGPDQGE